MTCPKTEINQKIKSLSIELEEAMANGNEDHALEVESFLDDLYNELEEQ